ncbi:MAG: GNAT family N-acetyltransferase [Candidatus Riflebacteria bacterium]|nr:GNAT family N-acetyltransferase [Candidatus Riflebacteria bacterium]
MNSFSEEFEIKLAKPEEWQVLEEVSKLEKEGFGESGLCSANLALLSRCGMLVLLIEKEKITGEGLFLKYFSEDSAILFSLVISSGLRRKGRALALMQTSFELLKPCGIKDLFLTVDPSNKPAMSLYSEKLNFKTIETLFDHFGPGQTRILMKKTLD